MPDYPAASSYLPQFFNCDGGNGNGYYCDPALDRRMRRVGALQLSDSLRAAALWEAINRRLVDDAAWVTTVNLLAPELVSKRVRNYQYSPVGGFLVHKAWLAWATPTPRVAAWPA
jgi:ABC-type transport system substrate-binding protein